MLLSRRLGPTQGSWDGSNIVKILDWLKVNPNLGASRDLKLRLGKYKRRKQQLLDVQLVWRLIFFISISLFEVTFYLENNLILNLIVLGKTDTSHTECRIYWE